MLTLIAYPIFLVFHWVAPESKLGRMVTLPLVKFVAYSASYLGFLGVLFIITVRPNGFYGAAQRLSEIYPHSMAFEPMYDLISSAQGYHRHSRHQPVASILNQPDNLYQIVQEFCNESRGRFFLDVEPEESAPNVADVGELTPVGVWRICKLNQDFVIRPHSDNWISWIVTIWIVGLLCRKIRQVIRGSFKAPGSTFVRSVFRSPFDILDFAQLAFFIAAFAVRFYAYIKVTEAVVFFVSVRPSPSRYALISQYLYWLPADRVFFHPLDPLTMSELLFATGGVFSFARLLYIFPALEVFGPCYLALMRVVKDIFAFFFVFFVVFAAFMIGTMNVYWYFNPAIRSAVQLNSSYDPVIPVEERFGNIELTFRTTFWSLFGLGESDYMSVDGFGQGSMIWVERIGFIMYGAYNIVVVCVLLNMLIAMMAKSYDEVKRNSEMEWKFARTILFLEYIPDNTPAIPMPFNLVPNPRYFYEMLSNLVDAVRPPRKRSVSKSVIDIDTDTEIHSPAQSSRTGPVKASIQIRIDNGEDDPITEHEQTKYSNDGKMLSVGDSSVLEMQTPNRSKLQSQSTNNVSNRFPSKF